MNENEEKVTGIILDQLSLGPACRIHLHREVCRKLGFSLDPLISDKGERVRICKEMSDSTFDVPLQKLLDLGLIEKIESGKAIGGFVFYNIREIKKKSTKGGTKP